MAATANSVSTPPEMSVDLILCRFGQPKFSTEPALSSFKRYFPDCRVILYTDEPSRDVHGVDEVKEVTSPFSRSEKRYGWWSSDYFRVVGMLESTADVAVYSDSDMYFCSDVVRTLPEITRRFHFCLPLNSRLVAKVDILMGTDSDKLVDPVGSHCAAYNTAPMSFDTHSATARQFLETYLRIFLAKPMRNPVVIHRAVMETGFSPFVLPFQWCVCAEHIGVGDEVVLHVGHKEVQSYYLGNAPKWLKEFRRMRHLFKLHFMPEPDMRQAVTKWERK